MFLYVFDQSQTVNKSAVDTASSDTVEHQALIKLTARDTSPKTKMQGDAGRWLSVDDGWAGTPLHFGYGGGRTSSQFEQVVGSQT